MAGFGPVGSGPVGSDTSSTAGALQVSEQAGAVAMVGTPAMLVTEQSGAVAFVNIPSVVITEQSVAIAMLLPNTPPPEPTRRRQFVLM